MDRRGAQKDTLSRRILIVEDDRDIAQVLEINLQTGCTQTRVVHDGITGLAEALSGHWDLLILDLMLPRLDGLTLCRRLRAQQHYMPVLMLTARGSEIDRIMGLEVGADDYLAKPFSVRELMARVKALFRRAEGFAAGAPPEPVLEQGDLRLDPEKRAVHLAGSEVRLTAKEFDLLHHFMRHPGRVYTRAQLLDAVWGHGHEGYEHTVNSHINRLRAKIEANPDCPRHLMTVWGVGYKFAEGPAT